MHPSKSQIVYSLYQYSSIIIVIINKIIIHYIIVIFINRCVVLAPGTCAPTHETILIVDDAIETI